MSPLNGVALKSFNILLLTRYKNRGAKELLLLYLDLVKMLHAYKFHRQEFGKAIQLSYTKAFPYTKTKIKNKIAFEPNILGTLCDSHFLY